MAEPISERYVLTPQEASEYFHISVKRLRQIATYHPGAEFAVYKGRHLLIIREEFEKFLRMTSSI